MWPFRKKERKARLPILPFKSGEGFFDYQCKYGQTDLIKNRGIVALVVDAQEYIGADYSVKRCEDGSQTAVLKVASEDGGFIAIGNTECSRGDTLSVGDVVIWVPTRYDDESGLALLDARMGWHGFIGARVAPEIDPNSDSFRILCRYV